MSESSFCIEADRLWLSHFIPTYQPHCAFLVTLYNSPLFISTEGQTEIVNEDKAQERINTRFVEEHKRNEYVVSHKPTSSAPLSESQTIGSVSLTRGTDPESLDIPDIGFAIIPEMIGKGYAIEAALALLNSVKVSQGLEELFGFITALDNGPSHRVMEKIGMQNRGVWPLACFGGVSGSVFTSPGFEHWENYGFTRLSPASA
ncbi:hypothetical protein LOCC1_G000469 [Lachnellula occidentalis]|uniref:N-acetyltransferase domain-containing protein n=1 Tax=Lachnellula occidentalis TaxID=215460 RepID=A0A8H8S9U7_9HELO|nr:hypothetical protein LOCC1_G000469 [Lachnellula occidentalis]